MTLTDKGEASLICDNLLFTIYVQQVMIALQELMRIY